MKNLSKILYGIKEIWRWRKPSRRDRGENLETMLKRHYDTKTPEWRSAAIRDVKSMVEWGDLERYYGDWLISRIKSIHYPQVGDQAR